MCPVFRHIGVLGGVQRDSAPLASSSSSSASSSSSPPPPPPSPYSSCADLVDLYQANGSGGAPQKLNTKQILHPDKALEKSSLEALPAALVQRLCEEVFYDANAALAALLGGGAGVANGDSNPAVLPTMLPTSWMCLNSSMREEGP